MVQNLSPAAIFQQKAVTQDKGFSSGLPLPKGKETLSNKRSTDQFLTKSGHCTAQTRHLLEILLHLFKAPDKASVLHCRQSSPQYPALINSTREKTTAARYRG